MRPLIATLVLLLLTSPAWADGALVGDPAAGEQRAKVCVACHNFTDPQHKIGPSLLGVFNRKAGSAANFAFSSSMTTFGANGGVWDEKTLDAYLTLPRAVVPGTKMTFAGLQNPQDRANVIAYLKTLSPQAAPPTAPAPPPVPPPSPVPEPQLGNADHGLVLVVTQNCVSCHNFTDHTNRVGPYLKGVYGEPIAHALGFSYSDALKRFADDNPVWDAATLDRFLADPKSLVPGTTMAARPVADPSDRDDIIAFLKALQ